MTYVEFFDKTDVENICTCLTYLPDRVIFLGNDRDMMEKAIGNYKKVFENRDSEIEFIARSVSRSNLEHGVSVLSEIVEEYDDCVFDITGGDEMLTLALGIVCEKYKDKKLQIHKFNFNNTAVYDCDRDGKTVYRDTPRLSVRENIRIYGGDVIYGGVENEECTYEWDMNPEFEADIENMWRICVKDPGAWNTQIGVFSAAEGVGTVRGLTTFARSSDMNSRFSRYGSDPVRIRRIVDGLAGIGVIKLNKEKGVTFSITYKNEQVKRCLVKAGQILEMKVYKTVKNLKNEDGSTVFNDAANGVQIDWNGMIGEERINGGIDTKNEIDVLAMKNMVPVFISCKNAPFKSDELYKLSTVAERFGDKYAKKVLVATSIPATEHKFRAVRQRIRDMGIILIDLTKEKSEDWFEKRLRNIVN